MEDIDHQINELKQETKILDKINTAFYDEMKQTKKDNFDLKKYLKYSDHKIKEKETLFASKRVQNPILKSEITICEVDKLSKAQFETILRHEFGHVLGLAPSTDPEDLLHPTIKTNYPHISNCDVDAIVSLYDGGKKNEMTCEN